MKSKIVLGRVHHHRDGKVSHRFSYGVYLYAFDLDELETLGRSSWLFGYNKFRAVSIWDRDYLQPGERPLRTKLEYFVKHAGCEQPIERVTLVTAARFFGYVFNPVSFYYCYGSNESLLCVVAEVNNTFRERHLYILRDLSDGLASDTSRYVVPKRFHVSPFYSMSGDYSFEFRAIGKEIDIRLHVVKAGKTFFRAELKGETVPLTTKRLLQIVLTRPLTAWLTMPRILWQAALLRFRYRLPVFTKPAPSSSMTIRTAPPRLRDRIGQRLVFRMLSGFKRGRLRLTMPNGSVFNFGDLHDQSPASIKICDLRFFWKVFRSGSVGFGEAYMDGDWTSSDPVKLMSLLALNLPRVDRSKSIVARLTERVRRRFHRRRRNSLFGSRRNIQAHYDLSNEFFNLFLDPSRSYSSGIFRTPEDSLVKAQERKLDQMIDNAQIRESDHVLEVGSGWGSFALRAVERTGCRVTTITISNEQYDFVRNVVRERGLDDHITVKLCDYRNITGSFSKIVSIEMLEAVGHEFLGEFFASCDRLLAPDGIVALQVITMPDQRYESYRQRCDWIQKYIFPGCNLPSLTALTEAMTRSSNLIVEDLRNIGPHYAPTLAAWRKDFLEKRAKVQKLGFDERFVRMWDYYLFYCEAAFATRSLNNLQLVLTRKQNAVLAGYRAEGLLEQSSKLVS